MSVLLHLLTLPVWRVNVSVLRRFAPVLKWPRIAEHSLIGHPKMAMMKQSAVAILNRFPAYKRLLKPFETFHSFHTAYPTGRRLPDGETVEATPELPVFGQPSLEQG